MESDSNPYKAPSSEIDGSKKALVMSFSTLNFWRKLYLCFVWLGALLVLASVVVGLAAGARNGMSCISIWQLLIVLLIPTMAFWTHYAVTQRSSDQIVALAIINLIPFGNIVGCLIMLSIWRVTKKEREQYDLVKA